MSELSQAFLVLADMSPEMHVAIRFASVRARKASGHVALLHVRRQSVLRHWFDVETLMKRESRHQAEVALRDITRTIQNLSGHPPSVYLREGKAAEVLFSVIESNPHIINVILAASTRADENAGPIVSYATGKGRCRFRIPFVIIPGSLSETDIERMA